MYATYSQNGWNDQARRRVAVASADIVADGFSHLTATDGVNGQLQNAVRSRIEPMPFVRTPLLNELLKYHEETERSLIELSEDRELAQP
jgi:hypothetical protein